jgi:hypothetical protein
MPPYNVHVHNYNSQDGGYNYDRTDRTERAPLTVGGTVVSTGGTFSTITLDSTHASSRNKRTTNTNYQGVENGNDVVALPPSRCRLSLFIAIALATAIIQYHYYAIWWAFGWTALLITTGTCSLIAGEKAKNVHLVNLLVWAVSAAAGVVLFGIFVVWYGKESLLLLCLTYASDKYSDYDSITIGVCGTLSDDGTLLKIWIGAVILGVVLVFPFMFYAIRTAYLFYAVAASNDRVQGR